MEGKNGKMSKTFQHFFPLKICYSSQQNVRHKPPNLDDVIKTRDKGDGKICLTKQRFNEKKEAHGHHKAAVS